ncbi:MAG: HlyD family efflux transporter periplasmic adaptor subunit [bacterium]|nr:HlyD family efflux transporter periplasmic adaptor subunit [bacterium]
MDEHSKLPSDSVSDTASEEAEYSQVAVLEQTLWKQLGDPKGLEAFAQAWLSLQCRFIKGARQGILVLRGDNTRSYAPVARWPENQESAADLTTTAELVLGERRGIIRKLDVGRGDTAGEFTAVLAYPVLIEDGIHGVVAIEATVHTESRLGSAMRQLQWGVASIRDRLRRALVQSQKEVIDQTTLALDIMSTVPEQERFQAGCRTAVTELATRIDCERVSVGFLKRGHVEVVTVSHSAEFGKQMNLVQMLGEAMDEAIDQRTILRYPQYEDDEPMVTRAHRELAHTHGAGTILTVPMFLRDNYIGAFTYERPGNTPFDQRAIDLLTGVTAMLGPVLDEKRQNDRWLISKAGKSVERQVGRLLGPGHIIRKLVAAAAILLVALGYVVDGEYRVAADARIEGKVQRALIAPFDGYIREAPVRAGEIVGEGTLLAALDDRDLALSRLKQVTERAQNQHRFEEALSQRDRSETNIIKTQIKKADAQIALIDEQLARARIAAPFAGIVVAGDLSQEIGGAVRRGEPLFEIAPLDEYRVILKVDEAQIADLEVGQRGELLATALPGTPFPLVVTRITPVAETHDGLNTFRVEAELEQASTRLRPGMEGVGKIDIGQRRLVWIWSRSLIEWFRLWSWRWLS